MNANLSIDKTKNVVIYINDFYPEFATAFTKLSERLGRPLRGVMLIDAERKANGKNLPDKEGLFEEIIVDFSDDVALSRALKPLEKNLLLVSCDSERSQLYFKKVVPHVPYVNTPTESSLDYSTDKGKMREMLSGYDDAISPKFVAVHEASETVVGEILANISFPMIIKPTNLAASLLVNKVNDEQELRHTLARSFEDLKKIYAKHRGLGEATMLVEEFVNGDIYSTDAYINQQGVAYILPFIYCRNGWMVGREGFQIYDSSTDVKLTQEEIARGQAVARSAMYAIGLRSSVAHIELFYTRDGEWKVIELGARPGGWRQETYEVSYGIDHALNELLVKVGREPDMPDSMKEYSGTFRIHAPKEGKVIAIRGIEVAEHHPAMHTLHVDVKVGEEVLPCARGGDMLIGGLMHGNDLAELKQQIDAVRDSISIIVE